MNKRCCICFVSLTLSASVSSAPLEEIFKNADYDKELSLRHRIENVRDTAFSHNALASTLRTRIGMSQTVNTKGLQFLLQADGVTNVGSTTYNTLSNGEDSHPVVSDPSFIEMNQAWLGYNVADTQVIAGRQVINILNERFIGSDAFRQNEQTYDAITVGAKAAIFFDNSSEQGRGRCETKGEDQRGFHERPKVDRNPPTCASGGVVNVPRRRSPGSLVGVERVDLGAYGARMVGRAAAARADDPCAGGEGIGHLRSGFIGRLLVDGLHVFQYG